MINKHGGHRATKENSFLFLNAGVLCG